jgi:hypothetical protein
MNSIFLIRLRALPGVDGVRALRAALKTLLRRYGLRCISIDMEREADDEKRSRRRCSPAKQ